MRLGVEVTQELRDLISDLNDISRRALIAARRIEGQLCQGRCCKKIEANPAVVGFDE